MTISTVFWTGKSPSRRLSPILLSGIMFPSCMGSALLWVGLTVLSVWEMQVRSMNTCMESSVKAKSTGFSLARPSFNWNGCDWTSLTSCFVILQEYWLTDAPRKPHNRRACYLRDDISLAWNETQEPVFQMLYQPLIHQGSWANYSSVPYWAGAQLSMEWKKNGSRWRFQLK